MFGTKKKAVTFSYDDGVTQDERLIEIFDKYGLKCTFNLNSQKLGLEDSLIREERRITHIKFKASDIPKIYKNHEVAVHTLDHPTLVGLEEQEIIRQVEQDRINLSEICGYEVVGMAYPNGPNDDRVAGIIRDHTGVKYSRTVTPTYNFDLQKNLYRFNPTIHHHNEFDRLFELAKEFINKEASEDQIFYIWGHAYELDIYGDWAKFEEFCRLISGHDDIFYGTNTEILLAK